VKLIDFEGIHRTFDCTMFDLCAECGGRCEYNTIVAFMPGEVEFTAQKLGLAVDAFVKQFCNTIRYDGRDIYILKNNDCPFLNAEYMCELEKHSCKPLCCLFYPGTIGHPDDKRKVFIDDEDCPMAHRVSEDFKTKSLGILEILKSQLPELWLDFFAGPMWRLYDREKLGHLRDQLQISTEQLKHCEIGSSE